MLKIENNIKSPSQVYFNVLSCQKTAVYLYWRSLITGISLPCPSASCRRVLFYAVFLLAVNYRRFAQREAF